MFVRFSTDSSFWGSLGKNAASPPKNIGFSNVDDHVASLREGRHVAEEPSQGSRASAMASVGTSATASRVAIR